MNLKIFTKAWHSTWMFSRIQALQRLTVVDMVHAHLHQSNHVEEDWKSLRPYLRWQSEQVIHDTYQITSRFGGTVPQGGMNLLLLIQSLVTQW